jgi:hypothetical protein
LRKSRAGLSATGKFIEASLLDIFKWFNENHEQTQHNKTGVGNEQKNWEK